MKNKLYTPGHYIGVGLHYVAAAGVLTAAVVLAQPWVIGVAAGIVGGGQYMSLRMNKRFFENKMKKHDDVHEHSPRLGEISRELYAKSGLKAENFPIYDFVVDEEKAAASKSGVMDKVLGAAMQQMSMTPNAAAVNVGKPVIMISTPLLKLLGDEEEKAVLAHEFAHAAARHHYVKMPLGFMLGVGTTALALTSIGAFFGAGFVGVLSGIGATVVGGAIGGIGYAKLSQMLRKGDEAGELKQLATKKRATFAAQMTGMASRAGIVSLFNPVYLAALAAARAAVVVKKLATTRFSRFHEYQADRGAVALGADPLALITALRKIHTISEMSVKAVYGELPKKGYLTKAWKKANATHPELDKRIAYLSKIARKQNASDSAIEQAVKGQLNIDDSHLMNPEIIRAMASR